MTKKTSRFLFLIHNKTLLKAIFNHFKKRPVKTNDVDSYNDNANRIVNYKFDCKNPRTFNEYLCWIKANYRNDEWYRCADKLGSKDFLTEHGFGKYVVKTLGVYNNSSEIDLSKFPNRFVLKTNHDCGSVFLCDKNKTDFERIFKSLDNSLNNKYSATNGEWVYDKIEPKIFAEEVVCPRIGNKLVDYKFFCFNGKFGWGFTGQDRNTDTRFCVFEGDFNIQNVEYIYLRPKKKDMPVKPEKFDEMVKTAEQISKLLDFVRVDFYDSIDGPKIGELTFFSQSGYGPFTNKFYDFKYGKFFNNVNLKGKKI